MSFLIHLQVRRTYLFGLHIPFPQREFLVATAFFASPVFKVVWLADIFLEFKVEYILLRMVGLNDGPLKQRILQNERSPTELAGPGASWVY